MMELIVTIARLSISTIALILSIYSLSMTITTRKRYTKLLKKYHDNDVLDFLLDITRLEQYQKFEPAGREMATRNWIKEMTEKYEKELNINCTKGNV